MPELDFDLVQDGEPTERDQQTAIRFDDEKKSIENDRLLLENDRLQGEIDDLTQDRKQREKYGNRLFWLVVGWLAAIGLIVFLHGFSGVPFDLDIAILSTLIGSTTASVLGLFIIVTNYLFPKRDSKGTYDREA